MKDRWKVFYIVFFAWILTAYDFWMIAIALLDVERTFLLNKGQAGTLAITTLVARLGGAFTFGMAADRWGRRLPLVITIFGTSGFGTLSGFSSSYTMLLAVRTAFGFFLGGLWATAVPLLMEHFYNRQRGGVSGLFQSGWCWGYISAALVFYVVVQQVEVDWRMPFFAGLLP